jgi:hypothetical protein
MTEQHLPAPAEPVPADPAVHRVLEEPRRPLSVAYLPLALVVFIILAFTIAAWTFLAAAG